MICLVFLVTACGGKGGGDPVAPAPENEPEPVEDEIPTTFDGAKQTWEVNYQAEGICSFVDVTVCPEGGDINTCDSSLLRSYDCPENMGSPPWYIYDLGGTCWFHAEPQQECEGPQCEPAFTGKVDCPE